MKQAIVLMLGFILVIATLTVVISVVQANATPDAAAPMAAQQLQAPPKAVEPVAAPAPRIWWSANSDFTECFKSHGPAGKLEDLQGGSTRPFTRDFKDGEGTIDKVEVVQPDDLNEHVWTYYSSQAACKTQAINADKALADRYR